MDSIRQPSARSSGKQQFHTWAIHLLPLLSIPIAVWFHINVQPVTAFDLWLLFIAWAITGGLGITIGYHRHFTHRAFHAVQPLRWLMAACGAMTGQGPVTYWVALHRKHHRHSDQVGDPHSPVANASAARSWWSGLLHSHFYWIADAQSPTLARYAADLIRDRVARVTGSIYYPLVLLGQLIPALVGWLWYGTWAGALAGLLWGGLLRLVVGNQIIWSVNSVCHVFGSQPHATCDQSRNNAIVAILGFGEGWHNNHHISPTAANFSHRWWQLDCGYWVIRAFAWIRLVHSVRINSETRPV